MFPVVLGFGRLLSADFPRVTEPKQSMQRLGEKTLMGPIKFLCCQSLPLQEFDAPGPLRHACRLSAWDTGSQFQPLESAVKPVASIRYEQDPGWRNRQLENLA